jgi:very-short-patch-repair endonuclease
MPTQLNNLIYLKETRKYLRNNLTEAECVLWSVLKGKKLDGRKFRRQHSIGYFIADFYCPSEKLIIELDGKHHFSPEGIEKDRERDEHLKELGIKVLRLENKEVLNNLSEVLKSIKSNFKTNED